MKEFKRKCDNCYECEWISGKISICTNILSKHWNDEVKSNFVCERWEPKSF